MLKRNIKVKLAPGTFQDTPKQFDFIISFEERVFDIITEVFSERPPLYDKPVCLIGLNVVDNHESAILGAMDVYNLLQLIDATEDEWIDQFDDVVAEFQMSLGKQVLDLMAFY
eukprot:TRINITY_DN4968_c0_g1_i6.p1 TRINITY_DN4968_c0_g1~~TRINITY_DN4968_c0_g1_i6.p1  ORF type:complete len:113 (-),score=25.37 TRINITY_DN4968_c0_g1_i6:153-491(-)